MLPRLRTSAQKPPLKNAPLGSITGIAASVSHGGPGAGLDKPRSRLLVRQNPGMQLNGSIDQILLYLGHCPFLPMAHVRLHDFGKLRGDHLLNLLRNLAIVGGMLIVPPPPVPTLWPVSIAPGAPESDAPVDLEHQLVHFRHPVLIGHANVGAEPHETMNDQAPKGCSSQEAIEERRLQHVLRHNVGFGLKQPLLRQGTECRFNGFGLGRASSHISLVATSLAILPVAAGIGNHRIYALPFRPNGQRPHGRADVITCPRNAVISESCAPAVASGRDRKSTRLNSSHSQISY